MRGGGLLCARDFIARRWHIKPWEPLIQARFALVHPPSAASRRYGCFWRNSKKSSEEFAQYIGLPLLCELPMNLDLTEALEEGKAEQYVMESPLYDQLFGALY